MYGSLRVVQRCKYNVARKIGGLVPASIPDGRGPDDINPLVAMLPRS